MKEYAKVHQKEHQVAGSLPAADSLKTGFCGVFLA